MSLYFNVGYQELVEAVKMPEYVRTFKALLLNSTIDLGIHYVSIAPLRKNKKTQNPARIQ